MVIQGHPGKVIYGQEPCSCAMSSHRSTHNATQKSAQWPAHDFRNLENASWMKMSGCPGVLKIIQL